MKIVFDLSPVTGNRTGVEYYALRLCTALRKAAGDSVIPVSRENVPEIPGTRVFPSALPLTLWRQICLPGILKKLKADSLHSPVTAFPVFPAVPTAVTIADLCYRTVPEGVPLISRMKQEFFCRAALHRAAVLCTVSETTRSRLIRFHPSAAEKSVTILSGGIANPDLADAHPAPEDETLLASMGIRKPYFLQTGRIDRRKCPVPAMKALLESGLNEVSLVFAGSPGNASGDVNDFLDQHPELKKRVRLPGYTESRVLRILLANAAALLYVSTDEGFGHPPLEAASCMVPSITAKIPVEIEILGKNGAMTDPEDIQEYASVMRRMILDRGFHSAILAGLRKRLAELNWDKTAEQVLRLHETLIRKRKI